MNPRVTFIRQREPNSATVLLMKLHLLWKVDHTGHWVPTKPQEAQESGRMGSSRRSHGQDGLFAPGAWREQPRDEVDRGPAGSGDISMR